MSKLIILIAILIPLTVTGLWVVGGGIEPDSIQRHSIAIP